MASQFQIPAPKPGETAEEYTLRLHLSTPNGQISERTKVVLTTAKFVALLAVVGGGGWKASSYVSSITTSIAEVAKAQAGAATKQDIVGIENRISRRVIKTVKKALTTDAEMDCPFPMNGHRRCPLVWVRRDDEDDGQ